MVVFRSTLAARFPGFIDGGELAQRLRHDRERAGIALAFGKLETRSPEPVLDFLDLPLGRAPHARDQRGPAAQAMAHTHAGAAQRDRRGRDARAVGKPAFKAAVERVERDLGRSDGVLHRDTFAIKAARQRHPFWRGNGVHDGFGICAGPGWLRAHLLNVPQLYWSSVTLSMVIFLEKEKNQSLANL